MKREMEKTLGHEKHKQQLELLREQNRISEERFAYLKDMERKLKQMLIEWRREENKNEVIRQMESLLFKKDEKKVAGKMQKKIESKYREVEGDIKPGVKVMIKKNHQVGVVLEIRGKRAVVKLGMLPMQVALTDLMMVQEKTGE